MVSEVGVEQSRLCLVVLAWEAIRAHYLGDIAKSIRAVSRRQASRVEHRGEVVVPIVAGLGGAAVGVGDLRQAVKGVVLIGRVASKRRYDRGLIAVIVVAVGGRHRRGAGGVDILVQLVQCVELPRMRSMQCSRGVVRVLRGMIAHVVECVLDVVPEGVGDLVQPMGVVVASL